MEGKYIYLIFLAIYFYLQYRAAQKKKRREQTPAGTKENSRQGKKPSTFQEIINEVQRQVQEAQQKKAPPSAPLQSKTKDKKFSFESYKSLADKHNKSKITYVPLTTNEKFSGVEGESVFTEEEMTTINTTHVTPSDAKPLHPLDLRQAIIAEAILNRPYE